MLDTRSLGSLTVSELGLGCMGMSAFYGTADEDEALATAKAPRLNVTSSWITRSAGPLSAGVGTAVQSSRDQREGPDEALHLLGCVPGSRWSPLPDRV